MKDHSTESQSMSLLARLTHIFVRVMAIVAGLGILVLGAISAAIFRVADNRFTWEDNWPLIGILVLVTLFLISVVRTAFKPIHPDTVRKCTALSAFILFSVFQQLTKDHPEFGQHTDHAGTTFIVSAILFFSLHRTASYWMIRSLDRKDSEPDVEAQASVEKEPPPAKDPETVAPGESSRYVM